MHLKLDVSLSVQANGNDINNITPPVQIRSVVIIGFAKVFMNAVAACLLGMVDQYPSRRFTPLWHTETTIAYLPTRRAHPRAISE